MIDGLFLALGQLGDRVFLRVLVRSLALTLVLVVLAAWGATWALQFVPPTGYGWIDTAVRWLSAAGFLVLLWLMFPAIAGLVISLFLDDIAEAVERRHYSADPPGTPLGLAEGLVYGARFGLLVLAVNLVALPFYLLALLAAGAGLLLYYGVNGYLLGREYFELVALRHADPPRARRIRKRFSKRIFVIGAVVAFAFTVPLVNLLTPLIATAWMVHVFKALKTDPDFVV
jgi:CysZ protein